MAKKVFGISGSLVYQEAQGIKINELFRSMTNLLYVVAQTFSSPSMSPWFLPLMLYSLLIYM